MQGGSSLSLLGFLRLAPLRCVCDAPTRRWCVPFNQSKRKPGVFALRLSLSSRHVIVPMLQKRSIVVGWVLRTVHDCAPS